MARCRPPRTFKPQLKDWGLIRRRVAETPTAINTISDLFHTTTADDNTITHTLAAHGMAISTRQAQQARLTNNWRRRDRQPEQREEQRQQTAAPVADLMKDSGRNCGREYLTTALQLQGHRARYLHIAAELRQQDPESSANRKPGKGQRRVEFINLGQIIYGVLTATTS